MNPFPIVFASLRRHWVMNLLFVLLIAVAVAIGVGITAQERALRQGSAHAADKFDILVAAPGSQTDIVMNTIFLRPSAVNLLEGPVWSKLLSDDRVDFAAPLAFGDSWHNHSIVGSTAQFVDYLSGGLKDGTMFADHEEAVIGVAVPLEIGDSFEPAHGHGIEAEEHHHHGVNIKVVGRMKATGTPWDSAIVVPVEQVWEVHSLGTGHADDEDHEHNEDHDDDHAHDEHDHEHDHHHDNGASAAAAQDHDHDEDHGAAHHDEHGGEHDHAPGEAHDHDDEDHPDHAVKLGPPFDGVDLPGVPAMVVHPKTVAGAYSLRSSYRTDHSMAFFPAEVLVEMYEMLGNASSVMRWMALGTQALVVAAILAAVLALMQIYRKQFAVLRALGAPKSYIFGAIWLYVATLVVFGAAIGLGLGWAVAQAVSQAFTAETGMAMRATIAAPELTLAAGFILIGFALALVPAFMLYRKPVVDALRGS
ncbi:hypothetical protein TH25_08105 [Thalassospira profundimaris]|uniref:ABC3 transporter permease C-terminal domain-containing protein n=1 Tax=Thalassospira profundimaris TaxID=502049 RepID=A0A367XDC3_9PROT|nr:ABC transporter permease [Thalassospira profundimaris]RCK51648.1 hypothetical protein TH25_08105 [Thalassospira profundimaris]